MHTGQCERVESAGRPDAHGDARSGLPADRRTGGGRREWRRGMSAKELAGMTAPWPFGRGPHVSPADARCDHWWWELHLPPMSGIQKRISNVFRRSQWRTRRPCLTAAVRLTSSSATQHPASTRSGPTTSSITEPTSANTRARAEFRTRRPMRSARGRTTPSAVRDPSYARGPRPRKELDGSG